ncbi:reverse transcriptase domain-containing protein [Tanacetum coccineum]
MTNLTDLLSKFVNSNTASTSGLGTLPSNTITNSKVDLKGITTRSGVAYQGPTIPTTYSSPPKVVERESKVIKDTVPPTNNRSTKDVQPLVVQVQPQVPNSEPAVTPVSAPMPNLKPSIPYPLRRNDERRREKSNGQIEKLYEIFKDLSFEISLTDALILMPKFASTLKALIGNKEKLSEMARTPLNEHCSVVILNKLPEKLRDPGKFLIPCDFPGMDECLALTDLGASINLMPLSVWKKLSLPELTPTCMTLELADRSITQPIVIFFSRKSRANPKFIIHESKSKVHNSRNKLVVANVSSSSSTLGISLDVAKLKDMVKAFLLNKKTQAPAPVKTVEKSCVTCGGSGTLPSNTITNPKVDLKGITTRSGVAYQGPTIPTTSSSPPKVVERETEVTKDTVPPTNNGSTKDVQPPVVQVETQVPNSEPVVALVVEPIEAPVSAPKPNPKLSIPYPFLSNDKKLGEMANNQNGKEFQIFQDLHFDISFADALILMPKFASVIKSLLK